MCGRGKRAYFLQNRLKFYGYENTLVLEGATTFNQVRVAAPGATVPPEEITRVKGLGFLRDKNTPDCFNGRVITRNGKLTAEELSAVTEAAEKFGNGQVAMTTRLTLEIQHIPFDNIEPCGSSWPSAAWRPAAPALKCGRWSAAKAPPASTDSSTPSPSARRFTSASITAIMR